LFPNYKAIVEWPWMHVTINELITAIYKIPYLSLYYH